MAVGVIGDVYDHHVDERGAAPACRPVSGPGGPITARLEYVEADSAVGATRAGQGPQSPPAPKPNARWPRCWPMLLDVPEVGRHDDFFSLGGDSILAVQLAARARDAGLPLTARMVFEHPAIRRTRRRDRR